MLEFLRLVRPRLQPRWSCYRGREAIVVTFRNRDVMTLPFHSGAFADRLVALLNENGLDATEAMQ